MHQNSTAASVLNSFIWTTTDKKLLQKLKENLVENSLIEFSLTFGSEDIEKELTTQISKNQAQLTGQAGLKALNALSGILEESKNKIQGYARLYNTLMILVLIGGVIFASFSAWYRPAYPSSNLILGAVAVLALAFFEAHQRVQEAIAAKDNLLSLARSGISSLEELERLSPGDIRNLTESRAMVETLGAAYKLKNKEKPKVDVLILAPKPEEFISVKRHLTGLDDSQHPVVKTNYTIGTIQALGGLASVALQETGAGARAVRSAAEMGILFFQPKIVLLVGKAAGLKDAALGDIVIGEKAHDYEPGKATPNGFMARVKSMPYSYDFLEQLRRFAQKANFEYKDKKILFGPIASGEKVIADARSDVIIQIKSYMEDTIAMEMEAIGLAEALHQFPYVRGGNIRSISDFANEEKSEMDKAGIQKQAIENAAAFTIDFLKQFDLSHIEANLPTTYPEASESFYYITGSNVIQGSNIQVGRDFNLGDSTSNT